MRLKNWFTGLSLQNAGALQVAVGAFITGFASLFVGLSATQPTAAAVYRMLFGSIGLLLVAVYRKERLWGGWNLLKISVICAVCFALDLVCFHRSIHYVGPGLATLLGNFQVFFLCLAAVLFHGEKINLRFAIALLLSLLGLFLLVGIDWKNVGNIYQEGVFYGLAVGIFYACATFSLRSSQMHENAIPACANLGIISLLSVPVLIFVAKCQGESLAIPTTLDWLYMIGNGIAGQLLGWMLISRGLPLISVSLGGLLILTQPAAAFILDIILLHRPTSQIDFLGLAITLFALYLGFANQQNRTPKPIEILPELAEIMDEDDQVISSESTL